MKKHVFSIALAFAGMACAPGAAASPVVVGFERFRAEDTSGVHPGLLLYNELKCGACHGMAGAQQQALPARGAPKLNTASERMRLDYLQAFITTPHAVKPGTTMPDLFAGWEPEKAREAGEALAHFLASAGGSLPADAKAPDAKTVEQGATLFHSVGCVACHEPTRKAGASEAGDEFWEAEVVEAPDRQVPSVPLPDFARKTTVAALTNFLRDPSHARPEGRMPNMTLNDTEARAIAAWLVHGRGDVPVDTVADSAIDPAKAEQGRALFQSVGCASCHDMDDTKSVLAAPALKFSAPLSGGCLAESPAESAPWFDLTDGQRATLSDLGSAALSEAPTPADRINHTAMALNCYACHDRNGLGGPEPGRAAYFAETDDQDLGDEGRIPPTLTGVGNKLTPPWLLDILTDEGRIRPYMATRMPHFEPAFVEPLAEALLEVDQEEDPTPVNVTGLEHHHRNHYGRELMGTDGLGCITCHNLDGNRSLGIPAVDLANTPKRLQPEWFMKYMLDPASLRPGTRMPAFFIDGKSQGSTLFGGDARKQIEALWIYLRELKQTRLPVGMESTESFELKPVDRPLVHRTFMKDIGTRAIAVGFPEGIHYAFDARAMRLAAVWRGAFIDGESAQADRYTPLVAPLGEAVAMLPDGPMVAAAPEGPWSVDALQFKGYRLDDSRAPVFAYQLGAVSVEEALRPEPDAKTFQRKLVFRGPEQTVYLRLGARDTEDTFKLGGVTLKTTSGATAISGPEEIGWLLAVDVTEAGTTIEQVLSW